MGTSLSGLTPATTFDALIKVGDNSALTASLKTISDGEGNDSPLKLSTSAVGIGSITNVETEINGKQATLVSGTNIKTINSTSLLGSGDISISASAGGSNSQIQFNDSGAFGADSLFNWDNTNKRLSVGETTPTARVHIKGEGATSATTSLLVQNSAGSNVLKVTDDRNIETYDATNNVITKNNAGNRRFQVNPAANSLVDLQVSGSGLSNLIRTDSGLNSVSIGTGGLSNTRFLVKGGGATSATTAFLVRNSSNTDLVKVIDDGQVLVNVQSAEASAKLQIDSTTQGFLPPRMTTTERNAIEATAGLVIYDTTTNKLQCYDGSSWNNLF